METSEFLKAVLGDEGWYCVFGAKDGKVKQKFYEKRELVAKVADQMNDSEMDAYFALATFSEPESRKAQNANQFKSFFVDIDCGDSKGYATKKEAIVALQNFCKEKKLSKPIVVDSGNGIHAYWPLTEAVSVDDWLPVAAGLKKSCVTHGLKIDPVVSDDAARVLRVPGTRNFKNGVARDVRVLVSSAPTEFDEFAEKVGRNGNTHPAVGSLFGEDKPVLEVSPKDNAILRILSGSIQSRFRTILEKTSRGKGCAQLAYIVKNRAEMPEPLWRAGLSIAKFCVDAEKASHIISKGYPAYDPDETEAKLRLIKGPYTCDKFDEFNPGICENCPNRTKVKSPIVLGREVAEASEEDNIIASTEPEKPKPFVVDPNVIPTYPAPYVRGKAGGVFIKTTDADGEPTVKNIYHNDLYVVRRIKDPEMGECLIIRLHLPRDGMREFLLPMTAATSKDEFRKTMAMQGVALIKMDELMVYVSTWVNELQANSVADDARRQFGWTSEAESFVLGANEYTPTDVFVNHPSSATVQYFHAFQPKGTLEGWKQAMQFYNRPGLEMHQFLVAAGFGSVLMEFIPNINAAGLHIFSPESGFGKTTALYAMMSIWGSYEELVITHQDTRNFSMNRAEVYKNLPVAIDEVTNMDPKALSELAMTVTGGKQRGRMSMSSNVERFRGNRWNTLFVTTANTSFIERVSAYKALPQAEAQRVLEHRISRFKFESKLETDNLNKILAENYGHAGPLFVTYVMKNLAEVEQLLAQIREKVDKSFGLDHQNRFWSAFISVTMTAAVIAKRIGLIPFETKPLFDRAKDLIEENRRSQNAMVRNTEDLLADYISENYNNFLHIDSSADLRGLKGKRDALQETYVVPSGTPRGELIGRFETDTRKLYLSRNPLKQWCIEQQVNYNNFVQELKKSYGAQPMKMRLCKGTNFTMPCRTVLMLEADMFDEFREDEQANSD